MRKLYNKYFPYIIVTLLVVVSTLLLWLPFLLKSQSWLGLQIQESNFGYIYKHFDGPLYVIAAKTWYNPQAIERVGLEFPIPPSYFAAHLPLYPFLINIFAPVMGFLKSMVFVTVASSLALALFFYYFVSSFKISKSPLLLTSVFLFLPRFLVTRSVGAPESLFMLFILVSLFFFEKKQYLWAGVAGGLAAVTKTPAILLLVAYAVVLFERFRKTKKIEWKTVSLLLIPAGLAGVFYIYLRQYGDFFAYFKSGDNIHLVSPFAAFNFQKIWVGTAWLEDLIFYFFLYGMAVLTLKEGKYRGLYYFSAVFFLAILFIQHRDIARYALPLWPLACIAFERFFTSRKFLMVALIIVLPAAYFYAWNFLMYNILPISDWAAFL